MRFIVKLQLVVLLILVSFRLSDGVKCTTDVLNPCRCTLSDGASGVVDISPLFSDGSLFCQQVSTGIPTLRYDYYYYPCVGTNCEAPCLSGDCAICRQPNFDFGSGIGSLDTAEYTITKYDPKSTSHFSTRVTYSLGVNNQNSIVDFIYNATAEKPIFVFDSENPPRTYRFILFTNGPGVQIVNTTVPSGSTSGPYPIQNDACTGWSRDKSVLASSGLLELSAQAAVLNYTWTKNKYTYEYYIGVCISPLSISSPDCYAVQKETSPNGDVSLHCLGGNVDVQVTDTKDEGWILLSYTYGNRDDFKCDGFAKRTRIYFFCSRGAGLGTPMYVNQQNPLREECFYQFNWPTEILCGELDTTQSNQAPLSLESSVLIGISGGSFLLIVFLLVVFTITACYLCGRRTSPSTNKYRLAERTQIQGERD